ncbi:hypothetical protein C8Q78DRAFT_1034330 [Trametes maxima]|nr:hypothetical protein C8Q78DRAFT_1034330 [Trametes maxima]
MISLSTLPTLVLMCCATRATRRLERPWMLRRSITAARTRDNTGLSFKSLCMSRVFRSLTSIPACQMDAHSIEQHL